MAADSTPAGEWQNAIPATAITVDNDGTVEKLQVTIEALLDEIGTLTGRVEALEAHHTGG